MICEEVTVLVGQPGLEAAAALLMDAGAEGVVFDEKDGLQAVRGYLPADGDLDARIDRLREGLDRLPTFFPGLRVRLSQERVDDASWKDRWKEFFHPLRVGQRIVIAPTWEDPDPRPGDLVLRLDPEMAFGTGSHPTTSGCLEELEHWIRPGIRVADVGCGSGILAIGAALLGAGRVLALDNDPQALKTARANARKNGADIDCRHGDLLEGVDEHFDLITANLVASLIVRLAPQAAARLETGGLLIGSGILDSKWAPVEAALKAAGMDIIRTVQKGEWMTVTGRKR